MDPTLYVQILNCITASGSRSHQLLAAWRKGGNHQTSHKMRARPHYLRARPHYYGCSPQPTSTFPPLQTLPYLPACNISWSPPPPPYLGQGGTTYPSTPLDIKSSIAASWPRDGLLTTSQAVTMNPRSQWSLFEFGKWLNCEEICIQKFSWCSGERGHSVLTCLMGRL